MQVVSSREYLYEMSYSILVEKNKKIHHKFISAAFFLHSLHSIKVNVLSIPKRERERERTREQQNFNIAI